MKHVFPWNSLVIAISAIFAASSVLASTGTIEEVIVTAQKREQKLSDVPLTVIAASGDQLKTTGISDITEMGKIAPSFTVNSTVYGYKVFSIRGINFNSQQISAAPAVSVYMDEAVIPYTAMTGAVLMDVERVEVLKGPQGTLFGQNATAGSINVIAAKPTDEFSAGVRAEVDHYGKTTLDSYISGPLSENLNGRVAVQTTQFGGWQKGYYLSNDENGEQDKGAIRVLLDWQPTEKLDILLNLNGNYDKSEFIQPQLALVAPAIPANAQPGLIGYPPGKDNRDAEITPGFDTNSDNKMHQAILRADYEINDNLTFTSITNGAWYDGFNPIDYDGIALANSSAEAFGEVDSFNQEIRLSGVAYDDRVNFVVGASYSDDDIKDGQTSFLYNYSALIPGSEYTIDYDITNESSAFFANIDYAFTDQFSISAGARYTEAEQSLKGCLYGNAQFNGLLGFLSSAFRGIAGLGAVPPGYFGPGTCATINDNIPNVPNPLGSGLVPDYLPVFTDDSQKENNTSWRLSVNYKPEDDQLFYGTVSRGYKAGVFPAQPNLINSEAQPVEQEELTSYEIGSKLSFMDNEMRLNLSAFYYDYKDKQFYTYLPVPVIGISSFIINIPESEAKGVDMDFTFLPNEKWTIRGAITFIDTEIKDFVAINGFGQPVDVSGKNFNYAPTWSGNLDAEYRFPASDDIDVFIGAGVQFASKSYSDLGEQDITENPSYETWDLRVGMESIMGWRASLFARNVTDEDYWSSIFYQGEGYSRYMGLPRTYGVSLSYEF